MAVIGKPPSAGSRVSPASVPAKKKALPALVPGRTITINPTLPSYTPGGASAGAQDQINQLRARYASLAGPNGQYEFDRSTGLADIARKRLELIYNRDRGYESSDNDAAARGIFNSGIRLKNRSDVAAQTEMGSQQLDAAAKNIMDQYKINMDAAANEYGAPAENRILSEDSASQYQNWLQNQPTPQAPASTQVFTYPQWIEYHRRAGTKGLPVDPAALKARYEAYAAAQSKLLAAR